MSVETVRLLSASEVAHILRLALGRRQWRDFLADCIRGHTPGLRGGLLLMPYAATKSEGKAARPLYRTADLRAFIEAARAADPELRPAPVRSDAYAVDTTIGVPWSMRSAKLLIVAGGGGRTRGAAAP